MTLLGHHDERDDVSNHQPHDCLLSRLFRRRSKKTSKLRVTGLCEGNSPVIGEFPAQKASKTQKYSHLMTSSWICAGVDWLYGVAYATFTGNNMLHGIQLFMQLEQKQKRFGHNRSCHLFRVKPFLKPPVTVK